MGKSEDIKNKTENTTWHPVSKVKKKKIFVLISKKIIRGKKEVFPQGLLFVFWETAGKKKQYPLRKDQNMSSRCLKKEK